MWHSGCTGRRGFGTIAMPTCVFVNRLEASTARVRHPLPVERARLCYGEQHAFLMKADGVTNGFRSSALRRAGWVVADVFRDADALQGAWSAERAVESRGIEVVAEQLRRLSPDVVCVDSPGDLTATELAALRNDDLLLVGEGSSPDEDPTILEAFDLVLTMHADLAEQRRAAGSPFHLRFPAFEPRVLAHLDVRTWRERVRVVTVVGAVDASNEGATKFLVEVAEKTPLRLWGALGLSQVVAPQLAARYDGDADGAARFARLVDAGIFVDPPSGSSHVGRLEAARMYEASGCGALVLTEYRDGLEERFVLGQEIVAYRSADECAGLVHFFLRHPDKAERVARAGQARTHRDHTYDARMAGISEVFRRQLARRGSARA